MEQKPEEIITNGTSKSVKFSEENCDISMNHIKSFGWIQQSSLSMHRVSNQHQSSVLTNYTMNNAGNMIREVISRNYGYGNGYITGSSLIPKKDKGSLELSSEKDSWRNSGRKSNLEADSNSMVSNLSMANSLSKTLFTSSTVISSNKSMVGSCSSSFPMSSHGQSLARTWDNNMQDYGISLRDWLESKGVQACSKNDKLCLFRNIVQIVDVAHSKNIALMELRPSSFLLFGNGDVKYIGPQIGSETWNVNQDSRKRRGLELETYPHDHLHGKMQKVDGLARPEACFISGYVKDNSAGRFSMANVDTNNYIYEGSSCGESWLMASHHAHLEKKWYAFPEGFKIEDLFSLNVYCLGLFLFEFLCYFESLEAHSAAMLDLHHRILPPSFLSEYPRESGFCFWLLDPQPSSRPTTREILKSELIYGFDKTKESSDEASSDDMVDDEESDLLLHFLVTLRRNMQSKVSNLLQTIKFLDVDINVVESGVASNERGMESQPCSISDSPRAKLLENMNELENVYYTMRSNAQVTESHANRPDIDVLTKREGLPLVQIPDNLPDTKDTSESDRVGIFFDGICKFARYNKLEVCGTLKNNNILHANNIICSLSFDGEEEYIAVAEVAKKIKIFEFASLLDDSVDVQYPVLEMSNKSEFSSICWNKYIRNYLASTDHDGLVQIWDSNRGQEISQYKEHEKRAWSVDFSQIDPTKFATGGDDCFLKIWSTNERNSICSIRNPSNICCVQLSAYSSHLLAFSSCDYRIRCYDVRHTRIPWCTLSGHDSSVSYVRFMDSGTIVSASTDSTLKLWDLRKTSLDGVSTDACNLTFKGHTNKKSFVGLAVMDGFIATGSETNEVYMYQKSLPMAMSCHKFGDEKSEDGEKHYFVSSLRWRIKSQMLLAANSNGTILILSP